MAKYFAIFDQNGKIWRLVAKLFCHFKLGQNVAKFDTGWQNLFCHFQSGIFWRWPVKKGGKFWEWQFYSPQFHHILWPLYWKNDTNPHSIAANFIRNMETFFASWTFLSMENHLTKMAVQLCKICQSLSRPERLHCSELPKVPRNSI